MFKSIPTQQPAYFDYGHKIGEFPNSEFIGNNGLYIGVHQELSNSDLEYIIEVFDDFIKTNTNISKQKKDAQNTAVFIITYNNAKTIEDLITKIISMIKTYNLIFLDRGSTDDTENIIKKMSYKIFKISEINLNDYITKNIFDENIIFFEAGGVQDSNDILTIKEKLDDGYDTVIASRFMLRSKLNAAETISFSRGIGNRLFTLIGNIMFNGNISDSINSFRGIKRRHLLAMNLNFKEFDVFYRMNIKTLKNQLKNYEFATREKERLSGSSKRSLLVSIPMLTRILISEKLKEK